MTNHAIAVANLGKSYHIGEVGATFNTFRDAISGINKRSNRRQKDVFWALRDISFEIASGEVVGVIGRNGAGKSTLLKLLARISAPSEGSIKLRGRVGALLEVGTGFHPELSGRENIYLNGSILGMSRKDIDRRFDDIVEFSELPTFLDLPVKHYSSGMYVRLAFAVAAHLEPEVLLVDEVLAVGDYRFQNKCLGRMGAMSNEGRTVIFISHSMSAVQALCTRAIVLESGRLVRDGLVEEAVGAYMGLQTDQQDVWDLTVADRTGGTGQIRLTRFWASEDGRTSSALRNGRVAQLSFGYEVDGDAVLSGVSVTAVVKTQLGTPVFYHHNLLTGLPFDGIRNRGVFRLQIPKLPLRQGMYVLDLYVTGDGGRTLHDTLMDAARMEVIDGNFFGTGADYSGAPGASVMVDGSWTVEPVTD